MDSFYFSTGGNNPSAIASHTGRLYVPLPLFNPSAVSISRLRTDAGEGRISGIGGILKAESEGEHENKTIVLLS